MKQSPGRLGALPYPKGPRFESGPRYVRQGDRSLAQVARPVVPIRPFVPGTRRDASLSRFAGGAVRCIGPQQLDTRPSSICVDSCGIRTFRKAGRGPEMASVDKEIRAGLCGVSPSGLRAVSYETEARRLQSLRARPPGVRFRATLRSHAAPTRPTEFAQA